MPKKFIPIIFIAVLLLLIIAGYFFCWPKFQEFIGKRKEIKTKDEQIEQKQEYLLNLESISNELSKYSDEISKINSALPISPSVAALFNFFQKASSENGLILTNIDVSQLFIHQQGQDLEAEQRIKNMPLSITVTGSYSAFKNFLSAIYMSARIIEVKSITFSSEALAKDLFDFYLELETHAY